MTCLLCVPRGDLVSSTLSFLAATGPQALCELWRRKGWHKVVVWGTGLCSLLAVARWGGCSTFLIQQCIESRITARENSKGRIKHTVCSSACVVLSLQDGWRVLYKQHHRSLCLSNFRLCQSAPLFVLQLLLKGMVVFTCNIKYIFSLSS